MTDFEFWVIMFIILYTHDMALYTKFIGREIITEQKHFNTILFMDLQNILPSKENWASPNFDTLQSDWFPCELDGTLREVGGDLQQSYRLIYGIRSYALLIYVWCRNCNW